MDFLHRTKKATVAAAVAAGAMWTGASQNGMSQADFAMVIGTFVVTWVVTFVVPNRAAK